MDIGKRQFLIGGAIGLSLVAQAAKAQPAPQAGGGRGGRGGRGAREIPHRMAKTTVLFKAPAQHPNALATQPDGLLWIGEQRDRPSPGQAPVPRPANTTPAREAAYLVDWNGKLLKTVPTDSQNTSGMAYGDDCVWMCANAAPFGVFQTDLNGNTVSHRQVPLGPAANGGGITGATWGDGKLWISSTRLTGLMRVDPKTWTPEFILPVQLPEGRNRLHGITWDNGAIWIVTGNDSTGFATGKPGLAKYDATTGELLETVDFVPGAADPHGLAMHEGSVIASDAGLHPGWQNNDSPFTGSIFRVDMI